MPTLSRLPNGTTVVTAPHRGESAAIGLWLEAGSRHEDAAHSGFTHLLEHLWFDGTRGADAATLAARLARLGGRVNATTGRELCALYARAPADALTGMAGLLSAMLVRPVEADHAVRRERAAIALEQQADARGRLDDHTFARLWPEHALGRPVSGEPRALSTVSGAALRRFHAATVCGARLYVVAVGDVAHAAVTDACAAALSALPAGAPAPRGVPPAPAQPRREPLAGPSPRLRWALPTPGWQDPDALATLCAAHLLGGGTASRLMRALRGDAPLAYGVEARPVLFRDAGALVIDTAAPPEHIGACRDTVTRAVASLSDEGPGDAELDLAATEMRARLIIEDDDPLARMQRLAREAIYLGGHPSRAARETALSALDGGAVRERLRTAWAQRLLLHPVALD